MDGRTADSRASTQVLGTDVEHRVRQESRGRREVGRVNLIDKLCGFKRRHSTANQAEKSL